MLRYGKGAEPAALKTARSTPGATWASIGAETRTPIRDALARDQGGLCAYCEQRVADWQIEHWKARADGGPDFVWANLLGVCPGNRGNVGGQHCDAARGAVRLFLHPVEGQGTDPIGLLRWLGDGRVTANHASARQDIEALVLNHPNLVRKRKAALDALRELKQRKRLPAEGALDVAPWPEFRETLRYWLYRHRR